MKYYVSLFIVFSTGVIFGSHDPIPSMRPDGTAPSPPPDYQAGELYIKEILPAPEKGVLDFEEGMPTTGRIAVIVESSLYADISAGVATYVADLTSHGYMPFVVSFSGTAVELRTLLQSYYAEAQSLCGAVLVGDLPYAIWEMMKEFDTVYYEADICDFFFMDLDGGWEDNNSISPFAAGRYDTRTGDLLCEIWVSRIGAQNMLIGTNSEADLINAYFSRNHAYRSGTATVSKQALHYTDTDWSGKLNTDLNELGAVYSIVESRAVGEDVDAGGADYENNWMDADYELIQVRVHGTATAQYWDDGTVTTSGDYLAKDPQAVFYNIFTCSGADFTTVNCLTRTAVMNPDASGLVAWSHTGTGGMISLGMGWHSSANFYSPLGLGESVGEAFRQWYNSCVVADDYYAEGYKPTPKWFNGMRLDGDGCMTIRSPTIRYVSKTGSDTFPYTSEATAARSVNDAFDAASNGDIILIGSGHYYLTEEMRVTTSKELTIKGTASGVATVLDASQIASNTKRCLRSDYDTSPVFENLTLIGGDVTLDDGSGYKRGGAVNMQGGVIRNCVISNNLASSGGGMFLGYDAVVENCLITDNHATSGGGGIHTMNSSEDVMVTGCVISNNVSDGYAGGVIATDGGTFENCIIANNTAAAQAGGFYMVDTDTRVLNCVIRANQAGADSYSGAGGGGVYLSNGSLVNTLVADNYSAGEGGGIYSSGWSGKTFFNAMTNITVAGNSSAASIGGVYVENVVKVLNSVVHGNSGTNFWWNGDTTDVSVDYCCLGSSYAGPGSNNIFVDPLYTGGGYYSLSTGSPCINAGLTVSWMLNTQDRDVFDLDGGPRVVGGIVDLGAYEADSSGGGVYPVPGSLYFSCYETYDVSSQNLCISSTDSNLTGFTCVSSTNWLQLGSELIAGGNVSTGISVTGQVSCLASSLSAGMHNSAVNVYTNAGVFAFQVPVFVNVMPLSTDALSFNQIESPQGTGVAFNVSLTAANSAGLTARNHDDDVSLSAYAPGGIATEVETSGTGTSVTEYLLYSWYHDSRSQIIYLSSELGEEAGAITNIAFYVTGEPGQDLNSFTVRFQHTALSSLDSSTFITAGWQTGFNANLAQSYFVENSWVNIPIDPPFEYNGSDNLWVDISFNNSSYTDSGIVRYTASSTPRYLQGYSDSGYGDPLTWGAGNMPSYRSLTYVPNIKFSLERESIQQVGISPSIATGAEFNDGVWSGDVVIDTACSNIYIVAECGSVLATSNIFHVENELPGPVPAAWLSGFGLPANTDPYGNPDNDPYTTLQEYVLNFNPTVSNDYFRITSVSNNSPFTVFFESSSERYYTLLGCSNLVEGVWLPLVGPRAGVGGNDSMTQESGDPANFYKIRVELP